MDSERESERVVLVCLKNRTREVRLEAESDACTDTPFPVSRLDQAIRAKFSDLPSLTSTSQRFVLHVCALHVACLHRRCMLRVCARRAN